MTSSTSSDTESPQVFDRIGDYLEFYSERTPEAVAIVFENLRIDYAELKRRVDECAMALYAAGIRKGARVAMMCTARPEFWIVFLATTRIGAIWVGLNPKYRLREMRHVVSDAEPVMLVAMAEFDGRHYADDIEDLKRCAPSLTNVVGIGDLGGDYIEFDVFTKSLSNCDLHAYAEACATVKKTDPALIVYTSGTTGVPKGAVLSHLSITAGAMLQTEHLRVPHPSMIVSFPINHVACVADTCATTFVKGGKIVFQERFDAEMMLSAIESERCTFLGGVPTMIQMMLAHPDFEKTDFTSVELIAWGGAPMPRDGIIKLQKHCARLMSLYGMTETAAHVVFGEEGASVEQMTGSIGKPDPSIGCRIVDECGKPCAIGDAGELQFKAEFLMVGYWQNPKATEEAFTDNGWLKTGDLAEWREDGTIRLVGRKSEMFKSGGYNVYPREIEATLESVPGVAMAAVIGVADDLFQEVGHAFVMPDGTEEISSESLRQA